MAGRGGGDASVGLLPWAAGALSDSDSDDEDGLAAALAPGERPDLDTEAADEEEEEGDSPQPPPQPPTAPSRPFLLRGTSPTFSLRSHSIFGGLEGAARPLGEPFKRPLPPPAPAPSRPPLPDYVAHPERWTKYSLHDVPETSDRSNRAVALEFLGDLRRRAGAQSPAPPDTCSPSFNQDPSSRGAGRIVFTKPAKTGERKRPPGDLREPGDEPVALGHLGSAGGPEGEGEGEEPPRGREEPQDADMGEEEAPHPEPSEPEPVGFHGSKKRSREHLRPKGPAEEENEEA
ncbi:protein TSSC4 [Sarcophilus harrisii]|uniref:U5 small nuclear ribonucleoprotein TSSC4 n=1 Tax=Sarcophilus harrisii TaxID=9305 RepID=A0A7N4PCP7_SARHA|nr:protein TSSC4 [Sarcophilus harrisii]